VKSIKGNEKERTNRKYQNKTNNSTNNFIAEMNDTNEPNGTKRKREEQSTGEDNSSRRLLSYGQILDSSRGEYYLSVIDGLNIDLTDAKFYAWKYKKKYIRAKEEKAALRKRIAELEGKLEVKEKNQQDVIDITKAVECHLCADKEATTKGSPTCQCPEEFFCQTCSDTWFATQLSKYQTEEQDDLFAAFVPKCSMCQL
jgi:hypothetical protein